jgi:hypothetical protein
MLNNNEQGREIRRGNISFEWFIPPTPLKGWGGVAGRAGFIKCNNEIN